MTAKEISSNAAISACEKGVQKGQFFALFHNMREAGMTANVISFKAASVISFKASCTASPKQAVLKVQKGALRKAC